MKATFVVSSLTCMLAAFGTPLAAQLPARAPGDSLRLGALHTDALRADPRQHQLQLQEAQTELRLRNIAAERLPALSAEGQAQYQSDVPSLPVQLPGVRLPSPPHDTYDARINAQESIFDPTARPRRAVEGAQLSENQAQIRTTLFGLRQEVNDAFFAATSLQERAAQIAATISDLEARRGEAGARVREGTSLPSDTASIEATILQRRQDEAELRANRRAALARLAQLVGRSLDQSDVLVLPDLAGEVSEARDRLAAVRTRPEYEQFATTRERLARQADLTAARERPRVSAFARVGYGKPGLNLLNNAFDSYWLAGVQVQWTPWTWGTVDRERETLALQQQIVATNEAAFTEGLRRAVQTDLATMDRLDAAVGMDSRIIALRERIERETRTRLQEGVVTAAEYADRNSDLLQARLAQTTHLIELIQTRAHFLTTLGVEVR